MLEHAVRTHADYRSSHGIRSTALRRELPDPGTDARKRNHRRRRSRSSSARTSRPSFTCSGLGPYLHEPAVIARLKNVHKKYFGHRGAIVVSGNWARRSARRSSSCSLPLNLRRTLARGLSRVRAGGAPRHLANRHQVKVKLSSIDVSKLLAALHGLTFFEVQKIITQAVLEDGVLGAGRH